MELTLVDAASFEIRGKIMIVLPNKMHDFYAKEEEDNTLSINSLS